MNMTFTSCQEGSTSCVWMCSSPAACCGPSCVCMCVCCISFLSPSSFSDFLVVFWGFPVFSYFLFPKTTLPQFFFSFKISGQLVLFLSCLSAQPISHFLPLFYSHSSCFAWLCFYQPCVLCYNFLSFYSHNPFHPFILTWIKFTLSINFLFDRVYLGTLLFVSH